MENVVQHASLFYENINLLHLIPLLSVHQRDSPHPIWPLQQTTCKSLVLRLLLGVLHASPALLHHSPGKDLLGLSGMN